MQAKVIVLLVGLCLVGIVGVAKADIAISRASADEAAAPQKAGEEQTKAEIEEQQARLEQEKNKCTKKKDQMACVRWGLYILALAENSPKEQEDLVKAEKLFAQACKGKNKVGCRFLAAVWGMQDKISKAVDMYTHACKLGDAQSCDLIEKLNQRALDKKLSKAPRVAFLGLSDGCRLFGYVSQWIQIQGDKETKAYCRVVGATANGVAAKGGQGPDGLGAGQVEAVKSGGNSCRDLQDDSMCTVLYAELQQAWESKQTLGQINLSVPSNVFNAIAEARRREPDAKRRETEERVRIREENSKRERCLIRCHLEDESDCPNRCNQFWRALRGED